MIVRDEAHFLGDCLASMQGLVDEVVLIDTGSRDATVEIAEKYGAKIGHFAWCNDFSAARNFALEQVQHEWVLYIDADERLRVPDAAAFRAALGDASKAAWKLRLHPKVNWTAYAELRLFRNDPRIRFAGEIHERLYDGVNAVCREDGLEIGELDAALDHVGYEADQRPKLARNIPLLQAYLARDPGRVYCWWHLGEQYALCEDWPAAEAAWEQGVEAVRRQVGKANDSQPHVSLIAARHARGEPVAALLDEALKLFPEHLGLQWMRAKIALERGAFAEAREVFARLAEVDAERFFDRDVAYEKALFTHHAQEGLALTAFRQGEFAAAERHYRKAAETSPEPVALRVKAQLAAAKVLR